MRLFVHRRQPCRVCQIVLVAYIPSLGMSSRKLAISEIGVTFPDDTFGKESRFGIPFTVSINITNSQVELRSDTPVHIEIIPLISVRVHLASRKFTITFQ